VSPDAAEDEVEVEVPEGAGAMGELQVDADTCEMGERSSEKSVLLGPMSWWGARSRANR